MVSSLGFSESGQIGREIRITIICQKSVVDSSNESTLLRLTIRRCCFARLIADSHRPPKYEALRMYEGPIECEARCNGLLGNFMFGLQDVFVVVRSLLVIQ